MEDNNCNYADDWLNFMLSQKNLWLTFTTRGTLTEEVSEQVFSKERRLQVYDFKKFLKVLSDKEAVAQSEVDAFMENCAKRWQTREGTYQIKRRRLKPDVRDSPECPSADIDMADI